MIKLFSGALSLLFILTNQISFSQSEKDSIISFDAYAGKFVRVTTNDGAVFEGQLLEIDLEKIGVLLETKVMEFILIKDIVEIEASKKGKTRENGFEAYPQQYFWTPSYLSLPKGTNYMKFNLLGPEIHYAVSNRFMVGGAMTWISAPMLFSFKYSIDISKKIHLGGGGYFGWGSYLSFGDFVFMPNIGITIGSDNRNLTISYGQPLSPSLFYFSSEGNPIFPSVFSLSGLLKLKDGASLVFEAHTGGTFSNGYFPFIMFMPGLRIPKKSNRSFQAGLGIVVIDGKLINFPIPSLSWYFVL